MVSSSSSHLDAALNWGDKVKSVPQTILIFILGACLGVLTSSIVRSSPLTCSVSSTYGLHGQEFTGADATPVAATAPRGSTVQEFSFNSSFALPPTAETTSEPLWDSLIPNWVGYVRTKTAAPLHVVAAFHQLHCLYKIRRAYYSRNETSQAFDSGLNGEDHTAYCFEYLRQTILCTVDSTIEPAELSKDGFLGWGFSRSCGDYKALMNWAQDHRAFDGYGLWPI